MPVDVKCLMMIGALLVVPVLFTRDARCTMSRQNLGRQHPPCDEKIDGNLRPCKGRRSRERRLRAVKPRRRQALRPFLQ